MLEEYSEYIIIYIVISIFYFLINYGITVRKVVKYNKQSFLDKQKVNLVGLFLQSAFWPLTLILTIITKISLIGV